jgi:hypothetical protein
MAKHGVDVTVHHDIATGAWPDLTEHGWATDAGQYANYAGRSQRSNQARVRRRTSSWWLRSWIEWPSLG